MGQVYHLLPQSFSFLLTPPPPLANNSTVSDLVEVQLCIEKLNLANSLKGAYGSQCRHSDGSVCLKVTDDEDFPGGLVSRLPLLPILGAHVPVLIGKLSPTCHN